MLLYMPFLNGHYLPCLFFYWQRFYEHGGEMQMPQDAPLEPSMDIFAVGLVPVGVLTL